MKEYGLGRGRKVCGVRQILDGDGKDKGIFICIWHCNGGAGRSPEEVKGLGDEQRLGSLACVQPHTANQDLTSVSASEITTPRFAMHPGIPSFESLP